MAQSPKGGVYGPPSKRHIGVCAIYSETTVSAYALMAWVGYILIRLELPPQKNALDPWSILYIRFVSLTFRQ